MMRKSVLLASALMASSAFAGLQLKPLQSVEDSLEKLREKYEVVVDSTIAYKFFEEDIAAGGYEYKYPDDSKVYIPEESGKEGEVSLCFELNSNEYSGGAVVLYGAEYNMKDVLYTGALEFWIKGTQGGEKCFVNLADDEAVDGVKTQIKVDIDNYGGVHPFWTKISIPLADFGRRGAFWNAKEKREIPSYFDWATVKEFLITIEKAANEDFKVWVDNIYVKKDVFDSSKTIDLPYWDEVKEVVEDHPGIPSEPVVVKDTLFRGNFEEKMFGYRYGKKTSFVSQATSSSDSVMALYFDNSDYSGINLNIGRPVDMKSLRENSGGIAFWAKFGKGADKVLIGLQDDESDQKQVATMLNLSDYAQGNKFDTGWTYFMIPLREFSSEGSFWDMETASSVPDQMDWSKVHELVMTTDKYINRVNPGSPVKVYIDNVVLIESVPGYVDPEKYWDSFASTEADRLLFDFEDGAEHWDAISGEKSSIGMKNDYQEDRGLRGQYGKRYMKISYSVNDWAFCTYPFARLSSPAEQTDWTKHSAITMDIKSERDEEIVTLKVSDAGHEEWQANVTLNRGWNKVTLPFRRFRKNPYYQKPSAVVDGKLDLSTVTDFSVEPKSLGITSSLIVDNITLTNSAK